MDHIKELEQLVTDFQDGKLTYQQFANGCAKVYAKDVRRVFTPRESHKYHSAQSL